MISENERSDWSRGTISTESCKLQLVTRDHFLSFITTCWNQIWWKQPMHEPAGALWGCDMQLQIWWRTIICAAGGCHIFSFLYMCVSALYVSAAHKSFLSNGDPQVHQAESHKFRMSNIHEEQSDKTNPDLFVWRLSKSKNPWRVNCRLHKSLV